MHLHCPLLHKNPPLGHVFFVLTFRTGNISQKNCCASYKATNNPSHFIDSDKGTRTDHADMMHNFQLFGLVWE